jgi:hypothetical protein
MLCVNKSPVTPHYLSVEEAFVRLNSLLPLAVRQAELDPPFRALHRAILRWLAIEGESPSLAALLVEAGVADGAAALEQLRAADLVVVNGGGRIVGAYPITLEITAHRVTLDGRTRYAMCAVDALAIGPMFNLGTRIESRCHTCAAPLSFAQDDQRIRPAHLLRDVHVGIAWQATGGCAAHSLCREMLFFCSASHAASWQAVSRERNSVLSLSQAIEFAKRFFLPLLADRPGVA